MRINKNSSITMANQGNMQGYANDVDSDLNTIFDRLRRTPDITTGTAAPATTPSRIGNIYVDTVSKKLYFATGHTSSSDWTIAN